MQQQRIRQRLQVAATFSAFFSTFFLLRIACYFGEDYVSLVAGGRRQIRNLKVGDRIWTIRSDGQKLIADEIMCIPHAGPTTFSNLFYFL